MWEDDSLLAVNPSAVVQNDDLPPSEKIAGLDDVSLLPSSCSPLQFFVRTISNGGHIVIRAGWKESVGSVLERVALIAGIPAYARQRLIYEGKQLDPEQSLLRCGIERDATLHLVGLLRSTTHLPAWRLGATLITFVSSLLKGENPPLHDRIHAADYIQSLIDSLFSLIAATDVEDAASHLNVFKSHSVTAALVLLYVSADTSQRECADVSIRRLVSRCKDSLLSNSCDWAVSSVAQCVSMVLELCSLLREVGIDDPLYLCCRSALGLLLAKHLDCRWSLKYQAGVVNVERSIFLFVRELAARLSSHLGSVLVGSSSTDMGSLESDVIAFSAFSLPFRAVVGDLYSYRRAVSITLGKRESRHLFAEIEQLYLIFKDLLRKISECLAKLECSFPSKSSSEECCAIPCSASLYLPILRELKKLARIYKDGEQQVVKVLSLRKASICLLIVRYVKRFEGQQWLLQDKDMTDIMDFETRRHMVMTLFPEVKDQDYQDMHEMLIDRVHLLEESFACIGSAKPESLHKRLFMRFKNEEATGHGVLREWFILVAHALFNPNNALFLQCSADQRRFHPNPASKVDPNHLKYFSFSGRMIALALRHKVQVGILLDRVLVLQLAEGSICLEDIRDADPILYNSCMKILAMDAEYIDSNALALTFVREVEHDLGQPRKVIELCPGGENIAVSSKNRKDYINLVIRHRFVTSISEQVEHFRQGFTDILPNRRLFFNSLKLEDLDWMLYGSESAICVEDWKAHTEYEGFEENNCQISWFWKIVEKMTAEERKALLFFWTSVKYLPYEGFRGLDCELCITRTLEPDDRLPTSHTCFYELLFPPYPSMHVMEDRFRLITQDHIGCSFGTP